jgi:hypothetical protein
LGTAVSTTLLAACDGFFCKAAVAAVGPIVGGLIIGGAIQIVTSRAQRRRAVMDLRHELITGMTDAASRLYIQTQLYWRARSGKDPVSRERLAELRTELDATYAEARARGLVLESQLDAYFDSEGPLARWHATMDFLTVRYFQVLVDDTGVQRAERLAKLYKANSSADCTGYAVDDLNKEPAVLSGYRQALREASLRVLTAKFRGQRQLRAAYNFSAAAAARRAAHDGVDEAQNEPRVPSGGGAGSPQQS